MASATTTKPPPDDTLPTDPAVRQEMMSIFLKSGDNDVMKSVHFDDRVAQSVQFQVEQAQGTLILCYVDPRGKLHHYYEFQNGEMNHAESTFTGDAFVVYQPTTTDANKPKTIHDLLYNDKYTILCSYRVKVPLNHGQVHQIHCIPGKSCTVKAAPKRDDEYRVSVGLPKSKCRLPPPLESWQVQYEYECPPLPCGDAWDPKTHTFYVWGDLDFDSYGDSHFADVPPHLRAVHPCYMNQIVPQTMIGNCVAISDPDTYKWTGKTFDSWVIQAQYYWQARKSDSRAHCGPAVQVEPGDLIRTRIEYNAHDGSIHVVIAVVGENGDERSDKRSEILLARPFLHDSSLFESWKDFFCKCIAAEEQGDDNNATIPSSSKVSRQDEVTKSPGLRGSVNSAESNIKGAMARPCLNVEYKGSVDLDILKSICPFHVKKASFPGVPLDFKWNTHLYSPRTGRVDILQDSEGKVSLAIDDAVTMK